MVYAFSLLVCWFTSSLVTGLGVADALTIPSTGPFIDPQLRKAEVAYIPTRDKTKEWKPLVQPRYKRDVDFESYCPYKDGHLVHATQTPVLTEEECDFLIQAVDRLPKLVYADEITPDGSLPPPRTKFVSNVGFDLGEEAMQIVRRALYQRIYPMLQAQFATYLPKRNFVVPKRKAKLRVAYMTVVAYDAETAGAKTDLFVHNEPYVVSFEIPLVEKTQYKGGGTWIEALQKSFVMDRGSMTSHASGIQHGGCAITAGKRYVLVGFCILDEKHDDWSRRFFDQVGHVA